MSLRSQGGPSFDPHIIVNEADYSPGSQVINFVVVDFDSGKVKHHRTLHISLFAVLYFSRIVHRLMNAGIDASELYASTKTEGAMV